MRSSPRIAKAFYEKCRKRIVLHDMDTNTFMTDPSGSWTKGLGLSHDRKGFGIRFTTTTYNPNKWEQGEIISIEDWGAI